MSDDLISQGLVAGPAGPDVAPMPAACGGDRSLPDLPPSPPCSECRHFTPPSRCARIPFPYEMPAALMTTGHCWEFEARTVAGQADASPPNAAATVDPRLLKSEPSAPLPPLPEYVTDAIWKHRHALAPGAAAPALAALVAAIRRYAEEAARGAGEPRSYKGRAVAVNGVTGEPLWCGCGDQLMADDIVCGNCEAGHNIGKRDDAASTPDPRPAGCVCPVERVRHVVRACPVHGERKP